MRLEVIRTLVAVYDTGSVVGAATRQGYSTSAVSRQIGAFQRELGMTLFEPDGRGIRATNALLDLVDEMRQLVEQADRLQARLRRTRSAAHQPSAGDRSMPIAPSALP
ncbi:LysR family transcriptional regulator [Microbacterium trichothecenolyticum]|uniref:LysR family transcriptional regulator n=1 Tax=Microbacterium ureisolvens TaxID=2781186 RepID=A0ABS7HZA7_9MICO|nr:LysR family transcriptional regulator [Microbacterium ureisolvens]MBW9120575.1 LysR family transcriptional regulator [Microbacterium trichothecenolyticum]